MTKQNVCICIILVFLHFSCKKETSFTDDISQVKEQISLQKVENNATESNQNSRSVGQNIIPLTSLGGGVYQAVWGALSLRITNVSYSTLDLYGQPLPIRNGDPAYGSLQPIGNNGGTITQDPEVGITNQFVGFVASTNSLTYTFDRNQFYSDKNAANQNWLTAYTAWQQNGSIGAAPVSQNIWVTDYISHVNTPSNISLITGKLIRITSGSTFAITELTYPAPPAPLPPPPPPPPPPPCTTCIPH